MELVGTKVNHQAYGAGIITAVDENTVTVCFGTEEEQKVYKRFPYLEAIHKYLEVVPEGNDRSNFAFLSCYWPDLAHIGETAELYLYSDPNGCIFKIGLLAEEIVKIIYRFENIPLPEDDRFSNLIRCLSRDNILPKNIDDILYAIRKERNRAAHIGLDKEETAGSVLRLGYRLSVWLMQVYGNWNYQPAAFVMPEKKDAQALQDRIQELEEKIQELEAEKTDINTNTAASQKTSEERESHAEEVAENLTLSASEEQVLIAQQIKLDVESSPVVNYAIQQNKRSVIQRITIFNESDTDIQAAELSISSSPEFLVPHIIPVYAVHAGQKFTIDKIDIPLNGEYLANLSERVEGQLQISLVSDGTQFYSDTIDVRVLAFNEWPGNSVYPELICSFVTPNHPAIESLIHRAGEILGDWTGDPGLDGYQSHDTNRVRMQAAAVYTAICEQNVIYAEPPASFEKSGQKIRLCDDLLNTKLGTCADLSVLYATCLEQMGLHPLLLSKPGHMFAGVWLIEEAFPDILFDDISGVTGRLADGVNEIAIVECTAMTAGKNIRFDDACSMAERTAMDYHSHFLIVDVCRARRSGIMPLPIRVKDASGQWKVTSEQAVVNPIKPEQRSTLQEEEEDTSPAGKKAQWERKLLDLGMRNALINLRWSRKGLIPIYSSSLDRLSQDLTENKKFTVLPKPLDWDKTGEEVEFESMQNLGRNKAIVDGDFANQKLRSGLNDVQLQNALKTLYRTARTDMEENGANTLYLALGLLRWFETERSTKPRYAPIILLPVELVKKSGNQGYSVVLRDEEPQMNITLLEKLKADFKMQIRGLDPLPTTDTGVNVRSVFTKMRRAVMGKKKWDVLEAAYLGIFSFSQFVMWNDLHNRSQELEENKIVQSLIGGKLAWKAQAMEIPDHVKESDVFLPVPVDASQLFAVRSAAEGKSFVLHGAPGTGKSQTITAMIVNALAQGKTVLFVAEKMAALEVVQKRLNDIGIGPFCLELHSNKTKKKDVLNQLRQAELVTRTNPSYYQEIANNLEKQRKDLNQYVNALYAGQNCGFSVYELINLYDRYHAAPEVVSFAPEQVKNLTKEQFEELQEVARNLEEFGKVAGSPATHPLKEFQLTSYSSLLAQQAEQAIRTLRDAMDTLKEKQKTIGYLTGLEESDAVEAYEAMLEVCENLQLLLPYPREWVKEADVEKYLRGIEHAETCYQSAKKKEQELQAFCKPEFFALEEKEYLRRASLDPETIWDQEPSVKECIEKLEHACDLKQQSSESCNALRQSWYDEIFDQDMKSKLESLNRAPATIYEQSEFIQKKVQELQAYAEHSQVAAELREELDGKWNASFYAMNGAELLRGYDAIVNKGFFSKLFHLGGYTQPILATAKGTMDKKVLRPELEKLAKYQEESAIVRKLQSEYDHLLQYAFPQYSLPEIGKMAKNVQAGYDWKMVSTLNAYRIYVMVARYAKEEFALDSLKDRLTEIQEYQQRQKDADANYASLKEEIVDIFEDENTEWTAVQKYLECGKELMGQDYYRKQMQKELAGRTKNPWMRFEEMVRLLHVLQDYKESYQEAQNSYAQYSTTVGYPQKVDEGIASLCQLAKNTIHACQSMDELPEGSVIRMRAGAMEEYQEDYDSYMQALTAAVDAEAKVYELLKIDASTKPVDSWTIDTVSRCDRWLDHMDRLRDWTNWNEAVERAEAKGLRPLAAVYQAGLSSDEVYNVFMKSMSMQLIETAVNESDPLRQFSGMVFETRIQRFKQLDEQFREVSKKETYYKLASNVPDLTTLASVSEEIRILQKAITSGGRGISIRNLFSQVPNMLEKLCPCMLMSPISAAQYLDPDTKPFDLVIFDEASQLTTCKAIGALARGKEAVIVGDPKQMPPTSFFTSNKLDEDNLEEEDLESILDDCLALSMPQTHLMWHYRSRHESLITFSNKQFYENGLYTFPSVNDKETKVHHVHVDGVYAHGRTRTNETEAKAIVEEIKRRCYDPQLHEQSIGVVTFNANQQGLIEDLFGDACAEDEILENWAYGSKEPIFIKNLENVQGDERDVILFSICYGPDEDGNVSMNFGPLNREGGWRRLNVAVSRSRCEMVVFSTLRPEQIDTNRTSAEGVKALQKFLEYAMGRELAVSEKDTKVTNVESSPVAESIAEELNAAGYETALAVGQSEYRVDVGVVDPQDPSRYLLGIQLDGPSYANSRTVRDREITQTSVLEGLGWTLARVYAIDWYHRREEVLQQLLQQIHTCEQVNQKKEAEKAKQQTQKASNPQVEQWLASNALLRKKTKPTMLEYTECVLPVKHVMNTDFAKGYFRNDVCRVIHKILEQDAPISYNVLTRRVAQAFGFTRAGKNINLEIDAALKEVGKESTVQGSTVILWKEKDIPSEYHLFRVNGPIMANREAKDIPVRELLNAVVFTAYYYRNLETQDTLIRRAADTMGFTRLGTNVISSFAEAIDAARKEGYLPRHSDSVQITASGISYAEKVIDAFYALHK